MLKASSRIVLLSLAAASPALAGLPPPALAVMSARGELNEGRQIELNAQVRYSGELLLFDSPKAMKLGLVYPYCISSGLAPSVGHAEAAALDGKQVQVKGTLLRFESASDEPSTISTLRVIDGMPFKNWCFGPYILRVEDLTVIH